MNTFYCPGCRGPVVGSRLGRLAEGAHRDGAPVGFCLGCLPRFLPELAIEGDEDDQGGELSA